MLLVGTSVHMPCRYGLADIVHVRRFSLAQREDSAIVFLVTEMACATIALYPAVTSNDISGVNRT